MTPIATATVATPGAATIVTSPHPMATTASTSTVIGRLSSVWVARRRLSGDQASSSAGWIWAWAAVARALRAGRRTRDEQRGSGDLLEVRRRPGGTQAKEQHRLGHQHQADRPPDSGRPWTIGAAPSTSRAAPRRS